MLPSTYVILLLYSTEFGLRQDQFQTAGLNIYISRQFICFYSPFGWIFMAEKISIVVVTTELLLGHV